MREIALLLCYIVVQLHYTFYALLKFCFLSPLIEPEVADFLKTLADKHNVDVIIVIKRFRSFGRSEKFAAIRDR